MPTSQLTTPVKDHQQQISSPSPPASKNRNIKKSSLQLTPDSKSVEKFNDSAPYFVKISNNKLVSAVPSINSSPQFTIVKRISKVTPLNETKHCTTKTNESNKNSMSAKIVTTQRAFKEKDRRFQNEINTSPNYSSTTIPCNHRRRRRQYRRRQKHIIMSTFKTDFLHKIDRSFDQILIKSKKRAANLIFPEALLIANEISSQNDKNTIPNSSIKQTFDKRIKLLSKIEFSAPNHLIINCATITNIEVSSDTPSTPQSTYQSTSDNPSTSRHQQNCNAIFTDKIFTPPFYKPIPMPPNLNKSNIDTKTLAAATTTIQVLPSTAPPYFIPLNDTPKKSEISNKNDDQPIKTNEINFIPDNLCNVNKHIVQQLLSSTAPSTSEITLIPTQTFLHKPPF